MFRGSVVGRWVAVALLVGLVGAACSEGGAQSTPTSGSVATLGPTATQGPTATEGPTATAGPTATPTPAAPVAPSAPTNLTASDVTLTNMAPCTAEDSQSDGCISLKWTPPAGHVDGYRIYIGEIGGTYIGGPGPSGWYVCPQNGSLATAVARLPAGKASYDLPILGEHGPACVALTAYNVAGESPWDIAMVGSEDATSLSSTWTTYKGAGFSVDFPGDYQTTSLATSMADGYEYTQTGACMPIGSESDPRLIFAVEQITFIGKTPPNAGPELASFIQKTIAFYAPYSVGDPAVSDIAGITVAGHAGFSFTLTQGSSVEKGEVFLAGGQVYGVVAGGAKGTANLATLTKFLGSFRFV